MKLINLVLVGLSFTLVSFLTSCSKENIDKETLEEEIIEPEVVVVDSMDCGNLVFESTSVNFDGASKAVIVKNDVPCGEGSGFSYFYMVVDANFDFWGGDPTFSDPTDGIPGFSFGSNDVPAIGDTVIQNSCCHLIKFDQATSYKFSDDMEIVLTEAGSQVGENIAGTISGNLDNGIGTIIPFTASFCSPIVSVCD